MKNFKISGIILILVFSFLTLGTSRCNPDQSADMKQAEATKKSMNEAQRQVGMPNIVNFQQRKMMKWIYELADKENLITYTYIKSDMTGKLIFIGKTLGYGVPFSAQFTNPMRIWDQESEGGASGKMNDAGELQVIPNPDPNGLYMPTSSSATWVILIDPKDGQPRPIYVEPEIVVSPIPLSQHLPGVVIGDESQWGKNK
jgi:hypothetical protein